MLEKLPKNDEVQNLMQPEGERLGEGRYLLFDSGCGECSEVAAEVEKEAQGWLKARSLSDLEVERKLTEARPDWKWEPTLLEIRDGKVLAFTGIAMKMRLLVGLGLRRARSVANIVRYGSGSDFRITFAPSKEDPGRYDITSVKRIDRLTALKTLGAAGLAAAFLPWLPSRLLAQEGQQSGTSRTRGNVNVTQVNLTPQQALNTFVSIRQSDESVRQLYANMMNKGFQIVSNQVRGVVTTAFADDGLAQGGSTVITLPYTRPDGVTARFYVSVEGASAGGGGANPGTVAADYSIMTASGGLNTFAVQNGAVTRVRTIENIEAEKQRLGINNVNASAQDSEARVSSNASESCRICTNAFNAIVGGGLGSLYGSIVAALVCAGLGPFCLGIVTAVVGIFVAFSYGYQGTAFDLCTFQLGYC